jgi:glycosyltransferase involved in cell wall biosynthesis
VSGSQGLGVSDPSLCAIVLTLDEERHLPDCLASLAWAGQRVVFDSFSTDRTCEIAQAHGADVIQHRFENYAAQRNAALDSVETEWVFFVDADERATPELAAEISQVIETPGPAGWWVPRHNYLFGKLTLHAGWFPDYQLRLLRRERARYDPDRPVHELVKLDGPAGKLRNPLIHLNYDTVGEFVAKQRRYADFDAEALRQAGERPRPRQFVTGPIRQFWWRFFTLQGYRDGWHGLRLSALMAYFEWIKLRKATSRL